MKIMLFNGIVYGIKVGCMMMAHFHHPNRDIYLET